MRSIVPFTNQEVGAVVARVAVAVVKRWRKHNPTHTVSPVLQVNSALRELEGLSLPVLQLALASLSAHLTAGLSSQQWRSDAIYRSSCGYDFRRCFFSEYKANRRTPPRVTNRGGQIAMFDNNEIAETEDNNAVKDGSEDKPSVSRGGLVNRDATERRLRLSDLAR